jgi:hypothetical protein
MGHPEPVTKQPEPVTKHLDPVTKHHPEPVTKHHPDPVTKHHPEPVTKHLDPVTKHPEPVMKHHPEPLTKHPESAGDVNGFLLDEPGDLTWFKTCDINDVRDTRLAEQNKYPQVQSRFA